MKRVVVAKFGWTQVARHFLALLQRGPIFG